MKIIQLKAVVDNLKKYCYFAKDEDLIEITEWEDGEGWDITIKESRLIKLTRGELDAIVYLTKALEIE